MMNQHNLIRAVELSARIELDFAPDAGGQNGPISYLLQRAQEDALQSLAAMIDIDVNLPDAAVAAQLRQHSRALDGYCDLVRYIKEAIAQGREARPQLDPEVQEDILETIGIYEASDA